MKRISEKKLEAFTVGTMGAIKRQLTKKELEDQKRKEEEAAAAKAFKEFVETFQDTPTASSKVWVKAGTYDAGSRREDNREKGKLYKPSSKIEEKTAAEKAHEYARMLASDLKKDTVPAKKKNQEKKKSNLELFKEELRQIQEEREERHKFKSIAGQAIAQHVTEQVPEVRETGSFDTGDPNTTNLYLGNLSPKISEQQLMEIFGRYGPLASIKIMWPRSEEEKQRGRNCGFVAYMSRKDAERALKTLNGRYIMGYEMRLGWGKSVPIMNQPIFIPPTLLELTLPPPSSGLPFNAQPPQSEIDNMPKVSYKECTTEEEKENMERILSKSIVKVFIPTEKSVLNVIHRMIEFVIREGPMFEALIMTREQENPLFAFLFDNESPAHIYYRWKLFSLLQGDTPTEWKEKEFRMFKGGPIWKPPIANFYTQGMPDELVVDPDAPEVHKGALSAAQRDRLEDIIRHLTPERLKIGEAMIFCIEHADAADEICECISESLANPSTFAFKKVARLYLISDILHNCTVKVANASFYRKSIEKHLIAIFENLHIFFTSIESRLKAEGFKSRVLNIIRTWEEWTVYPKDFLARLRSIFLGKQIDEPKPIEDLEDIDGAPLSGDEKDDEDLDGVPLDGAALLKGALLRSMPEGGPLQKEKSVHRTRERSRERDYNDDIDGIPLDDDIDGMPLDKLHSDHSNSLSKNNLKGSGAFIPSKWETVDPDQIEAQAVTTSKWVSLDRSQDPKYNDSDEELNFQTYSENKRAMLREVEMKTMQYQDELEAGEQELKSGWTVAEQVDHYRKKLLKKNSEMEGESPLSYDSMESSRKSHHRRDSSSPGQNSSSPTTSRKRGYSPYNTYKRKDYASPTMSSSRSSKSSKRNRSRSPSDSPKRSSLYALKSNRYESPSNRSHGSPSYSSRSAKRDDRDDGSSNSRSPTSRLRHDRHKHKHKH